MLKHPVTSTMRFSPVKKSLSKLLDIKSLRMLDNISTFNPSPLTLQQLVDFGKNASEEESYTFIKKEVPVRLANIMKEINLLPSTLLQMPSVIVLQEWYARSFMELCAFQGRSTDRDSLKEFVTTLATISRRHANAVQTMAQGVLELKESHAMDLQTENSIQYFLDRFYMSRISTRMLLNQHSSLFGVDEDESGVPETRPNRIGMIDTECNLKKVVMEAYNNAAFLCEEYYYMAPDINITVKYPGSDQGVINVSYPPQHLYHMLFELFKNSMRATVENKPKNSAELPDIEVLLAKGKDDVTIRVGDQGGGIPRRKTDHIFHYLFSTAPRPSMNSVKAPLAGYGYGLPLSRLYARYFNGDLVVHSCEGYGTDAVIYLRGKPSEAMELLPVFNKTSTRQYKQAVPTPDWTDPTSNIGQRHYLYHLYPPKKSLDDARDEKE